MLKRFAVFLSVFQTILLLGHYFLFETLVFALGIADRSVQLRLAIALAVLSVCFLGASLLGFRYFNVVVRTFYKVSAVWLGTFSYLFMAACAWWLVYGVLSVAKVNFSPRVGGSAVRSGTRDECLWRGECRLDARETHCRSTRGIAGFLARANHRAGERLAPRQRARCAIYAANRTKDLA